MSDHNPLFNRFSLSDLLSQQPTHLREKIGEASSEYILNVNEDEYLKHLESEFIFEVPHLDCEHIEIAEQVEKSVNIDDYGRRIQRTGTFITFAVPFTGERELFFCRPSTFTTGNSIRAKVTKENELLITLESSGDHENIRKTLDGILNNVENHLSWQRSQTEIWNKQLPSLAATEFKNRKNKLLQDAGVLGSLGFPLRKRANVPASFSVPFKKKISIGRPPAKAEPYDAHPTITEAAYQDILAALKGMALTMERSPSAFKGMGEEDLRMHFLVTLNGSFEADGVGEAFNFDGKTDILLRKDGRNLFIAECKFWGGSKQFAETIDQLLDYLTWRDSHTAIIVLLGVQRCRQF